MPGVSILQKRTDPLCKPNHCTIGIVATKLDGTGSYLIKGSWRDQQLDFAELTTDC